MCEKKTFTFSLSASILGFTLLLLSLFDSNPSLCPDP